MTTSIPEPQFLISIVREIAASIVMPWFRRLDATQVTAKSSPFDLVTAVDQEAEDAIRRAILSKFPETVAIGEEAAEKKPELLERIANAECCVIIDPIDGTGNFVAGLTTFGMILAVTQRGETTFGLLYDPVMDDWVTAERGAGAEYVSSCGRKTKLRTRPARSPMNCEGFVSMGLWPASERSQRLAELDHVGYVRSLRCSCHEYRTLALGKADFVFNAARKPWDHAAGVLVATEAGGASDIGFGERYRPTSFEGGFWVASCEETLSSLIVGHRSERNNVGSMTRL